MSYINMDHAAWVQDRINGSKPRATKGDKRKAQEHSCGWAAAPDDLNDFQKRAFNILGIAGGGIYNAPIAWDSLYWRPQAIGCSWRGGLATFDFDALTMFVLLCHEARIRGEVSPLSPSYLRISLHARVADGSVGKRHPDLDEVVADWCAGFPAAHSIVYREPAEQGA